MMMILLPIYYLTFKEKKNETNEYNFYAEFKNQLKNLLHSRVLLLTILLIFLWKISPGFTTPLLYYQTDQLQFNSSFIGLLYSLLAAGGIIGAIMYNHLCKHINLRLLLIIGITIDAIDSLIYLAYNGQVSAVLITALNGITAALCALPLYDLAARATPKKSESIGYALILSVWNVADALSDVLASKLYDAYNIQFHSLVWINTLSTLAIILGRPSVLNILLTSNNVVPLAISIAIPLTLTSIFSENIPSLSFYYSISYKQLKTRYFKPSFFLVYKKNSIKSFY